ncbi:MAG: hypothetical protein J7641_13375 [Cyanobacteria bacterium SID2]|nr:hypothetical protein [Cyanobacteria bacterium SID2]MBP0006619.1 hypothetical protein [Cyanobacteria bacterium SBC]
MLGTFQASHLRIEVDAPAKSIGRCLLYPIELQKWLPQQLSPGLPEKLSEGLTFTSSIGFVSIEHHVEVASDRCLRMLLSQGIDGFHEWYWGDGWVQSRLEGVSLLPLNLGQTFSLWRFKEFLATLHVSDTP